MCDLQGARFQVEEANSKRLPVLFHGLLFCPTSQSEAGEWKLEKVKVTAHEKK